MKDKIISQFGIFNIIFILSILVFSILVHAQTTYDSNGRVASDKSTFQISNELQGAEKTIFQYDDSGNLVKKTYSMFAQDSADLNDANGACSIESVDYTYEKKSYKCLQDDGTQGDCYYDVVKSIDDGQDIMEFEYDNGGFVSNKKVNGLEIGEKCTFSHCEIWEGDEVYIFPPKDLGDFEKSSILKDSLSNFDRAINDPINSQNSNKNICDFDSSLCGSKNNRVICPASRDCTGADYDRVNNMKSQLKRWINT